MIKKNNDENNDLRLVVPEHGRGALRTGGTPGNRGGSGRPPSAIREAARLAFSERLHVLTDIADDDETRPIDRIRAIDLLSMDLPEVRFSLRCSSGTYVRSIARDLGQALGVGAHLTALRRTSIGAFHVGAAIPVDALQDRTRVDAVAVPPLDSVGHLRAIEIDAEVAERLSHGQKIRLAEVTEDGLVAVAHAGDVGVSSCLAACSQSSSYSRLARSARR